MSFGLARGRDLDDAPGQVGLTPAELPPLADDLLTNPEANWVDPRGWFGNPSLPLEIEIGCGKGGFIVEQAAASPTTNFLGLENAREFYLYTADRLRRRGLTNVRMAYADATEFLRWRCAPSVATVIHLYYSDPWPKRRHHKNRVIQHRFLADACRVLFPGGELRVVTDHDELWAWCADQFEAWTAVDGPIPSDLRMSLDLPAQPFELLPFPAPPWSEEGRLVGTNYERKFTHAGRPPHSCVLRKSI